MRYKPYHHREGKEIENLIFDIALVKSSDEFRNRLIYTIQEKMEYYNSYKNFSEEWCINIIKQCNKYINAQLNETYLLEYEFVSQPFFSEIATFIRNEKDTNKFITAIEIICKVIIEVTKKRGGRIQQKVNECIEEINDCFSDYGLGYEFNVEQKEIIKFSSERTYKDIVKPAFELLHDPIFENAEKDFAIAFNHFRNGKFEDSIVSANRSFEGVMKVICMERQWNYRGGNSKNLLETLFKNNLIPKFQQNYFKELKNLLKSGIPPIRDVKGAHAIVGEEGPSEFLVEFVLDMTASCIKLLVRYHKEE